MPPLRTAPLFWTALGLVLGILAADAWPIPAGWWLLGAGCTATLALVFLLVDRKRRGSVPLWPVPLLLSVLLVGAARHRLQMAPPPPFPLDTTAVVLAGVQKTPEATAYGLRFPARTHLLLIGPDTLRAHVLLDVRLVADSLPTLRCGYRALLGGRLEPLRAPRNPGLPDRTTQWRRQGVVARLVVDDPRLVQVLDVRRCFADRLASLRDSVAAVLQQYMPRPEARHVVQALLLGDRSGLSADVRNRLGRAGLAHLLAISGLHVLLVGLVLYGLLRPLLLRLGLSWWVMEWTRTVLTLLVLSGYVLLAGAPASAVRALVMAALFLGATLFQTPPHSLNALGAAAVVLLLADPAQLFEPGFQLSFAAVIGLLLGWLPLQQRLPALFFRQPTFRYLTGTLLVTLTATLATAPFVLYHFGYVSLAGLPLNLPGIPLAAGALAGGLLTVLSAPFSPTLAGLFGHAATLCAHLLLQLGELGLRLLRPFVWHVPEPPWWVLITPPVLLGILSSSSRGRRWSGTVLLGVLGLGLWTTPPTSPHLDVLFFDVGHGDAVLIRAPGGRHLLIDAGGRYAGRVAAERSVLPFLRRYGIDRLDAVLITHPDADHAGGLPLLLRRLEVGRVLDSGTADSSALSREIAHLIDSLRLPRRSLQAGDTVRLDPALVLQVLAPAPNAGDLPDNERSVVLRMVFGQTRWLFLGDAERELERQLVRAYGNLLESDVVKVAHHGSRTSSTLELVQQVIPERTHPARAVISSGWRSVDDSVRVRWERQGARLWITADSGALWLRSDGRRIWPVAWRRAQ
ncbi:DNA internalization-related competence protein ComEC/Rec2 [Rhodothermus marinus SG0.5JP17-172]|uniref:DNA internalization-related competence protein ComEC/Rec2 n=1 Tax=Rhodothermus marinus TaxID=29549 RepID=UPI000223D41A|nr:DNA internalization-related competence protein ComEC/Rec2 [Rhodothermus marinus]AEN71984.1 DNA internalization-related competence protein ComEC/Rec2 [Rhodothermus marinus SG0.5JP17-172]